LEYPSYVKLKVLPSAGLPLWYLQQKGSERVVRVSRKGAVLENGDVPALTRIRAAEDDRADKPRLLEDFL
jgi:hypothetical protein